jgi:predicted nucleic acid-binding protein
LLLSDEPINTEDYAITSLTEYEIGNVIWKEKKSGRISEPQEIATIFSETINTLRKIEVDSMAKVLALAIARNLTFYDASYAYLAEKEGLKLVTQDTDLLKKCKVAMPIERMV